MEMTMTTASPVRSQRRGKTRLEPVLENETVEAPVTEVTAVEEASPAKEIEPVLTEEEKDETEVQSERKASVTSETSEMGSMESLEAQTDSSSTNSDDDSENSCSDTDIIIPTNDEKPQDIKVEEIKIKIVQT